VQRARAAAAADAHNQVDLSARRARPLEPQACPDQVAHMESATQHVQAEPTTTSLSHDRDYRDGAGPDAAAPSARTATVAAVSTARAALSLRATARGMDGRIRVDE